MNTPLKEFLFGRTNTIKKEMFLEKFIIQNDKVIIDELVDEE